MEVFSALWQYSSFMYVCQDEDDDYESPDDDQEQEDEADYESPTEEPEEAEHDSDGYEPPPSNNEEAQHNVIFPAKSLANSTDYIGNYWKVIVLNNLLIRFSHTVSHILAVW